MRPIPPRGPARRSRLAGALPVLLLGAAVLAALVPLAKGASMASEHPIVAFARDFSNGDAAIVERSRGFVADPPTDLPTVGFYGAEDYPPQARAFLAAVTLLDNEGKLDSVEDKYSLEILWLWREAGVIDPETMPPAAKDVFGPLSDRSRFSEGWEEAEVERFREIAWKEYGQATLELERHIAGRGRTLLSVDATEGDTMFFALVPPEVGERWRGRGLAEYEGYVAGVRAPMWDRYWDHLAYALGGLDEGREGYPPGTPRRAPSLPSGPLR